MLDKEKLNGTNFINWYRNLGIILKQEKQDYVLEVPYPDEPPANATTVVRRAREKHCNNSIDVSCLMLATMSSELQRQYENTNAHDMIVALWGMFENQARAERFNTSKALFVCRLTKCC